MTFFPEELFYQKFYMELSHKMSSIVENFMLPQNQLCFNYVCIFVSLDWRTLNLI